MLPYQDPSLATEQRVADLVARLTPEERASLMLYKSPAVERLGIPAYNWWNECLHGIARNGRATIFPQPIGLAATFNTALIKQVASTIADEARAKHHAAVRAGNRGQYTGLTFWTPTINLFRDPRWGRGSETYGEDPYLTGELGAAFVAGLQGDHPKYLKAAGCAKHFAVHSGPEKLRHGFNAKVSKKDLHETYLPAFKRLVDAGVEAVMGAYNRVNDEPCCGSKVLLKDILRDSWGFKGHVVSDCWAIEDIHKHHKVTADKLHSIALAINNGCDLCCGEIYESLLEAVKAGLVTQEMIDTSVSRLLTTRMKLGQFDPPEQVPFTSIGTDMINAPAHRQLAREAAAQGVVLLKNRNNILPLKDGAYKKILVVGPNAVSMDALFGSYAGMSSRMVTVLEGIIGALPEGITVDYKAGCLLNQFSANSIDWSVFEAKLNDLTIAVMGLNTLIEGEEGDAIASTGDREDIRLPENQRRYLDKLSRTGKPLVVILLAGSALAIPEVAEYADAILYGWYPGEEGGNAIADVLTGKCSPAGRLPITLQKANEDLPPYEDYAMAGRTYRYQETAPLFPFGFGLSYSTFTYSDLKLEKSAIKERTPLSFSFKLTNTGAVAADEVVQCYLAEREREPNQPLYRLCSFERVHLRPNESRTLSFTLPASQLTHYTEAGELEVDHGSYRLIVGGASPHPRSQELGAPPPLTATFTIEL